MTYLVAPLALGGPAPPTQNVEIFGNQTRDDYFGGSTTSHAWDYNNVAGATDGGFFVLVASTNPTTAVSYDGSGNQLTKIFDNGFSSSGMSIWIAPPGFPTGVNEIIVTHSSATSASVAFASGLQYFDFDETILSGLFDTNVGSATVTSLNLTPDEFSLVVDILSKNGGFGPELLGDAGQVAFYVDQSSNSIASSATRNSVQTGANVELEHDWFGGSAQFAHGIAEFKGKS